MWDSAATVDRNLASAIGRESIDVSAAISALVAGTNVLAVQVLNFSSANPDLLFQPELIAARSVTTPRVLGPYAVEWEPTDFHDDVLGRLGGVFRGTVVQLRAGEGFFVADAFWLPPDGDPIGPMALDVSLKANPAGGTIVHVVQTGFEESAR